MLRNIQEKIFAGLHISKEHLLNDMALLLARQQLSEHSMKINFYQKKYGTEFQNFDRNFRMQKASYEMENDWMDWKFALETRAYWQDILEKTEK
jgi:hypothetical protein